MRRFWPRLRPVRWWLVLLIVILAIGPLVAVAEVALFARLVDQVLVPADLAPLLGIALLFVGLNLLSAVASGSKDYLSTWVSQRFLVDLRTDVFQHVLGGPPAVQDKRRVGDLVARLTSDSSAVERLLVSGASSGVTAVIKIVVYTVALFWLQWQLALLSFLVVPLFWGVGAKFAQLVKEVSRERQRRGGSLSAVAEEHLGNAPLVQAYGREKDAVRRFHHQSRGIAHAELAASRVRSIFTPAVDLAELVGTLLVIGLGTWTISSGRLTLGGLLAFLTLLTQLYGPLRDLTHLVPSLFSASAGAERILELLDQPISVDRPGAITLPPGGGRLRFDRLTVRYPGATRDALREFSLEIAPGEVVAVVGPSGAGKSTLAKALVRLVDPTGGSVLIDGYDVRDVTMQSLRERVTFVQQETLMLDGTMHDNIAFARPEATHAEVLAVAEAADADGFIRDLPDGYQTPVGQRGRSLSGGQRQRIAIARAMLRDATVLVLDEPTTGLDEHTARQVLSGLRTLTEGRSTLLVTHDPVALEIADRVVHLEPVRRHRVPDLKALRPKRLAGARHG